MSLNINVRLGGSGGGGGRQAKLSAKQSHQTNKQVVQSSSNGIIQGLKVAKRAGSSALGGSEALLSFTANSVRLGIVYGGVKTAERGLYVLSKSKNRRQFRFKHCLW
jgi:hypothetical protein